MTPNGGEPHECGEEPTTHDESDAWADRAPRGRVRCAGCGGEWDLGDWNIGNASCRCKHPEEDEE